MTTSISNDLYDGVISWGPFAGLEHLEVSITEIDKEREILDAIVRFPPNEVISMHKHCAQTNMFVIQGELRIYEPSGELREVRPAGHYYRGRRDDVHTEGGGEEGAVVLYSVRGHGENDLFELMDENQNVQAVVGWKELSADS